MIHYTWRAGPFSFLLRATTTIAPPSRARAGNCSGAWTGAAAFDYFTGSLAFGLPFARERRRCWSAPLFFAARHFGSATCIGNPPDPS